MNESLEIRTRLDILQKQKLDIDAAIDKAKRKAKANGVYANRQEFNDMLQKSKSLGVRISRLQTELAVALKAERVAAASSFENTFVSKARELLREAEFHRIMDATYEACNMVPPKRSPKAPEVTPALPLAQPESRMRRFFKTLIGAN